MVGGSGSRLGLGMRSFSVVGVCVCVWVGGWVCVGALPHTQLRHGCRVIIVPESKQCCLYTHTHIHTHWRARAHVCTHRIEELEKRKQEAAEAESEFLAAHSQTVEHKLGMEQARWEQIRRQKEEAAAAEAAFLSEHSSTKSKRTKEETQR